VGCGGSLQMGSLPASLVNEVWSNGAGVSFRLDTFPEFLTIDGIPTRVSAEVLGTLPFAVGEYLAVAMSRSFLRPGDYVVLAYRRPRTETHATNFVLAVWVLIASILGVAGSALTNDLASGATLCSISALAATASALRLRAVRHPQRA
jgi:hypothetical protein